MTSRQMTFNPNQYETVYGFSTLDELHNFMPEMLYDETLFPNEMLAYMRYRIRTLFQETYVRQQHLYTMYSAQQRRTSFAEWRRSRTDPLRAAPPLGTTPVQRDITEQMVEAVAAALNTAVGTTGPIPSNIHVQIPRVDPTRRRVTTLPAAVTMPPLRRSRDNDTFSGIFQNTPGTLNFLIGNMLNELGTGTAGTMWDDVEVAATETDIAVGSTLIEENAVADDMNCAICQEHTHEEGEGSWRRLHCSHEFHIECIDSWLSQSVYCPVCRADIRDYPARTAGRRSYAAAAGGAAAAAAAPAAGSANTLPAGTGRLVGVNTVGTTAVPASQSPRGGSAER